eukprot:g16483.t1
MTKCNHAGCNIHASFNEEGSKVALFCGKHAEDGMVDVRNKRCKHEFCTTRPHFNHLGTKGALFCEKHAEDGMVDVGNQAIYCKHPGGCSKQQIYGYLVDGIASRCAQHKTDLYKESGLVINYKQKCKVKGCGSVVNWGPAGEHPTHCNKHGAPKETDGFVCIPKKTNGRGRAAASRSRRGVSGGGGAKKARKAQPRGVNTSSEESESEEESEEESDSSDDEEYEGEDDSEPELEPSKKRRIIWL